LKNIARLERRPGPLQYLHHHAALSFILLVVVPGLALGAGARWWRQHAPASTPVHSPKTASSVPFFRPGEPPSSHTLESIFAAEGFTRWERLVLWLETATAPEVAAAAKRCRNAGSRYDPLTRDLIYLKWVTLDPLAAIHSEPSDPAWRAWAQVDPDAALRRALVCLDNTPRSIVLRCIAENDPARVQELLKKHPRYSDEVVQLGLAAGLAKTDPQAAAQLSLRSCFSRNVSAIVSRRDNITSWAESDPEAALSWAKSVPSPARRVKALTEIIKMWEFSHPERIGPAIESLPPSQSRNRLIIEHAARLALTNPDAALAWARSVESVEIRHASVAEAARVVISRDPAKGEQLLQTIDVSSIIKSLTGTDVSSYNSAMSTMGGKDPLRAMALADSLYPSRASAARTSALSGWLSVDPAAASAWLESQPPEDRDPAAVRTAVEHFASGPAPDHSSAFHWAVAASDPSKHELQRAINVFDDWLEHDPSAAEKALSHPALPEKVRQHIAEKQEARQTEKPH
jgi:hypothetical protein